MRKHFYFLITLGLILNLFLACSPLKSTTTYDEGVLINGVRWATRNVDKPGTFAKKPKDPGMFYQWNRKLMWNVTENISDWDATIPKGDAWEKHNDPSPIGWRLSNLEEIKTLFDREKVTNEWTTVEGVKGRKFTDIITGKSIFLPAVRNRDSSTGKLMSIDYGYYWASTRYSSDVAYNIVFGKIRSNWGYYIYKNQAMSIRSVAE